jgi:hypothetical protein
MRLSIIAWILFLHIGFTYGQSTNANAYSTGDIYLGMSFKKLKPFIDFSKKEASYYKLSVDGSCYNIPLKSGYDQNYLSIPVSGAEVNIANKEVIAIDMMVTHNTSYLAIVKAVTAIFGNPGYYDKAALLCVWDVETCQIIVDGTIDPLFYTITLSYKNYY